MAIDANGTKIAVFGGIPGWAEPPTPELYVLDLNSKEWRKAPNATSPRSFPACALVGDQFIIWGGQNTKNPSGDGSMLLFDLSKFEWVTTYTPPSYLLPTKPTTTASPGASVTSEAPAPTKNESSSINIGAIIGGVIGALAAIATVAGVFIYRRRRQKNQKSEIPEAKDVKQGHAPPEYYGKQEHGLMEGVSEDYGKTPVYSPQLIDNTSRHPQQMPLLGRNPHGELALEHEDIGQ
ncbi:hypothetical protein BCR41DRAFT_11941 [Lobosporangium transversale]|uniref:Galactose oxidase n=1 Tax=Lobosporangium transversale TaxID=64571 RepID=A0A1Y2H3H9_9FUNG|nr:hypothetical protein BCR41DRAFT_11941 [Lobosporangium transversale]ORZ29120.1 hypothetical protein BCR41DRAFT_11941 [Lobosporangium transversale]|eukprot:XP_021886793.1 hypothetical protein BCR41DRAFT_11941 [Lobosporangium transversale]